MKAKNNLTTIFHIETQQSLIITQICSTMTGKQINMNTL